MTAEAGVFTKTILKQLRQQGFIIRQGSQAVADIAGREDVEVAAQPAAGTAVETGRSVPLRMIVVRTEQEAREIVAAKYVLFLGAVALVLADFADLKSAFTLGHSRRVAELARRWARHEHLSDEDWAFLGALGVLFFEPSTRTRTSFEIAGKRLSADVVNFTASASSLTKGETLVDTARNLEALNADIIVIRHQDSGAVALLADKVSCSVVNAGDGRHAHPTQGLLDMYTIRHFKGDFDRLTVAIVGDIVHSRVARSDIHALATLGVPEIRAVGPKTLVPNDLAAMGVRVCHDMVEGVRDADVIIMLRLQNERMSGALLPSAAEFAKSWGLTPDKLSLAKPDAIVMHPGPVNRGVELSHDLADRRPSGSGAVRCRSGRRSTSRRRSPTRSPQRTNTASSIAT